MNPYASNIIPSIGHPMTTRKKPTPKDIVPYSQRAKEVICKQKQNGKTKLERRRDLIIATFHEELQGGLQSNGQHYARYK